MVVMFRTVPGVLCMPVVLDFTAVRLALYKNTVEVKNEPKYRPNLS